MYSRLKVKLYPIKLHALAQCSNSLYPQYALIKACGELTRLGADTLLGPPQSQPEPLDLFCWGRFEVWSLNNPPKKCAFYQDPYTQGHRTLKMGSESGFARPLETHP